MHWPRPGGRKPNAIRDTERTQGLLVPGAIYVLVKRFTSKEERRRLVACIYHPNRVRAERVGFENHLNDFHARGRGLPMDFANGLAAFLNATLVDVYFRHFNGHTQVNAYTFLALLHVAPDVPWSAASNPLRGITPIIESIAKTSAHVLSEAVACTVERVSGMSPAPAESHTGASPVRKRYHPGDGRADRCEDTKASRRVARRSARLPPVVE